MNSTRKKLAPEPSYAVTDEELRDELQWDAYCREIEAQIRGQSWLVLAIPADLQAELMAEKQVSVVH